MATNKISSYVAMATNPREKSAEKFRPIFSCISITPKALKPDKGNSIYVIFIFIFI